MNLPNKLSTARICMIPVFIIVFYLGFLSKWFFLAAAVVFALAACTDFLDGHIARSRNLVTTLGKFLDPIADKVLVSTALILLLTCPTAFTIKPLGIAGLIAAGVCVAVILARELIVSGFRMIAAGKNVVLAADKLGKIKTILQDVAIVCLLFSMATLNCLFGQIVAWIGLVCFALCTVFTIISGANYLIKNRAVLKDDGTKE